jgi:PIN domain nuclease of toxin-antitoxin system
MSTLLDTHILLWALTEPDRLPADARTELENPSLDAWFSAVSIWEIAIKSSGPRADFTVDPQVVRRELLDLGFIELAVTGAHAAAVATLPPIHRDPFDRLLVAQATLEGLPLVTHDATVARYPGPIRLV